MAAALAIRAPLRAVPAGFWAALLGLVLAGYGLARRQPPVLAAGGLLLALGAWHLRRFFRRRGRWG